MTARRARFRFDKDCMATATDIPTSRQVGLARIVTILRARTVLTLLLCSIGSVWVVGCSDPPLDYLEVKRVDERLTPEELATFLRIVSELPEKTLPALPAVFLPPPEWDTTRTLPVSELIHEEKTLLAERTSIEYLASSLASDRKLARILRRERMTIKQFVGLTMCIGIALSRQSMEEQPDFKDLLETGQRVLKTLERDATPYADYPPERQFLVMQQAGWLTRLARCQQLSIVPEENVQMVGENRAELAKIFPTDFTRHPLASIADPLEETGTPFTEQPGSGSDAEISWNPRTAIVGTDAPPDPTAVSARSSAVSSSAAP